MNYAKIRRYDTSNWDGINTTLFVSGCHFHCEGCFNKEAQDFKYGKEFTSEIEDVLIEFAKDPHVVGVCILGGEPFDQNILKMLHLLDRIKREVKKPIHVWTGYLIEDLINDNRRCLLPYIDTLVDGQFMLDKKDLTLKYRGSSNQRVIDVKDYLRRYKI